MSGENGFIVHRLRSKPVEYTVTISHFVRAGKWVMSVGVDNVEDDRENKLRVAADLRAAAEWIEEDYGAPEPSTDNPIPPAGSRNVTLEPQ
jgi:hypothetical protein